MTRAMKGMIAAILTAGALMSVGCAYGDTAITQDGKLVIARNDGFLFGLLRKVFVCQVTPAGLAQCASSESP